MSQRTTDGHVLARLVQMMVPVCRAAEKQCPRVGRGRRPEIPDWVMAVLIGVVVLKRLKSKRSQYRFLSENRRWLLELIGADRFPSQTTYFDRYHRAHYLFNVAIELQGQNQIRSGTITAETVAVDRSVVESRGPRWHAKAIKRQKSWPSGADRDATWAKSTHHGWVQGYSFEVLISADFDGCCWPLVASVDPANVKERKTFESKINRLPDSTKWVLADKGYDSNALAEAVEQKGHRWVAPQIDRHRRYKADPQPFTDSPKRIAARRRRQKRRKFYDSRRGQKLYQRRGRTVEPFNEWFKSLFELKQAWHRGMPNNRTQVLAALFAYQILLRFNRQNKRKNAKVKWIIDLL